VLSHVMGNLNELAFEEIWHSERADRTRHEARNCRTGCWMVCTARPSMQRHRARVLAWALRHKLLPRQPL
jgi:hypothetical protein